MATPEEKKRISQEALENASVKEQAASVSTAPSSGRSKGYETAEELESLRRKTKTGGVGGMEALAERMSRIPDKK